jgi:hypothetical protein
MAMIYALDIKIDEKRQIVYYVNVIILLIHKLELIKRTKNDYADSCYWVSSGNWCDRLYNINRYKK